MSGRPVPARVKDLGRGGHVVAGAAVKNMGAVRHSQWRKDRTPQKGHAPPADRHTCQKGKIVRDSPSAPEDALARGRPGPRDP